MTDEIDTIINEFAGAKKRDRAWDRWPAKARRFVARVCERNDAGTVNMSIREVVAVLRERFDVETSAATIERYATRELGRKTWRIR